MALTAANLKLVAGGGTGNVWHYTTADAPATVDSVVASSKLVIMLAPTSTRALLHISNLVSDNIIPLYKKIMREGCSRASPQDQ